MNRFGGFSGAGTPLVLLKDNVRMLWTGVGVIGLDGANAPEVVEEASQDHNVSKVHIKTFKQESKLIRGFATTQGRPLEVDIVMVKTRK